VTKAEPEITPDMIKAGMDVLADLEGEASRAFLVEAVYLAMRAAAPSG
jgi:hypothetical protein